MLKFTVFDYLNRLNPDEKLEFFLETRSELSFLPSYWFNFDTVKKNISKYDTPELHSLSYLIGRKLEDVNKFFTDRPEAIKIVPYLLGIREGKFKHPSKERVLSVQGLDGVYDLDFKNINMAEIEKYLSFIHDSGLSWALTVGLKYSVHDYAVGVEAGMDSNARKNRSGDLGEAYLSEVLKYISDQSGFIRRGQTTALQIKEIFKIELPDNLSRKRFDGVLFDTNKHQLHLFEVNNFSSSGSKIKSTTGEFDNMREFVSRTGHQFIYITDGKGWDSEKTHLRYALENIGKVFNYKMIESGYLQALLT